MFIYTKSNVFAEQYKKDFPIGKTWGKSMFIIVHLLKSCDHQCILQV